MLHLSLTTRQSLFYRLALLGQVGYKDMHVEKGLQFSRQLNDWERLMQFFRKVWKLGEHLVRQKVDCDVKRGVILEGWGIVSEQSGTSQQQQ